MDITDLMVHHIFHIERDHCHFLGDIREYPEITAGGKANKSGQNPDFGGVRVPKFGQTPKGGGALIFGQNAEKNSMYSIYVDVPISTKNKCSISSVIISGDVKY